MTNELPVADDVVAMFRTPFPVVGMMAAVEGVEALYGPDTRIRAADNIDGWLVISLPKATNTPSDATEIHPLIAASGIEHWQADCARCGGELSSRMLAEGKISRAEALSQPMWLCPKCGNKRCPKSSWHGYKCNGSNEPGQAATLEESE